MLKRRSHLQYITCVYFCLVFFGAREPEPEPFNGTRGKRAMFSSADTCGPCPRRHRIPQCRSRTTKSIACWAALFIFRFAAARSIFSRTLIPSGAPHCASNPLTSLFAWHRGNQHKFIHNRHGFFSSANLEHRDHLAGSRALRCSCHALRQRRQPLPPPPKHRPRLETKSTIMAATLPAAVCKPDCILARPHTRSGDPVRHFGGRGPFTMGGGVPPSVLPSKHPNPCGECALRCPGTFLAHPPDACRPDW